MQNGHNDDDTDREAQDDITTVVSDQSEHAAYQGAHELSVLERRTIEIAEGLGNAAGDKRYLALMDLAGAWREMGKGCHDFARGFEAAARLIKR